MKKLLLSTLALGLICVPVIANNTNTKLTTQETYSIETYNTSYTSPIVSVNETFTNDTNNYDYDAVITFESTYYDTTASNAFNAVLGLSFLFPLVTIDNATYYSITEINNVETLVPIVSTDLSNKTITIHIEDLEYNTDYYFDFAFIINITINFPIVLNPQITIGFIDNVLLVNNAAPDNGLSTGAIVGIVVGSIAGAFILMYLVSRYYKYKA